MVKYSLSPRKLPRAEPKGTLEGSGFIDRPSAVGAVVQTASLLILSLSDSSFSSKSFKHLHSQIVRKGS